ncbi:MAG: hypothetical protein NC206_03755 [Bacteroides sp.]|nr:hypothetical protein [Roseburia sp.]MCM1346182.1 hypothetical protein [Bacteroides sp.]MCM1420681.1 hypothetical protein [Bacteroides sp.]
MRKRNLNVITVVATLLFFVTQNCFAQYPWEITGWAIASYNESLQEFSVLEYGPKQGVTINGKEFRCISWLWENIHDDECPLSRYGFAVYDKRVYLYDFETGEETLCMDYNLQKGEMFTTYNGEKWEVIETKDTLITELGHEKEHKVLIVSNVGDGRVDKWVEGAASFTNFLMIEKEQPGMTTHLLWTQSSDSYITNEFSADPLFGHDTGWLQAEEWGEEKKETTLEYKDGLLIIDDSYYSWPSRYYSCYLRKGDDIFCAYSIELQPHYDGGEYVLRNDVFYLKGLPEPASGSYNVHWGDKILSTGVRGVGADSPTTHTIFDLQGRKLNAAPAHGIYIEDGVKRLGK